MSQIEEMGGREGEENLEEAERGALSAGRRVRKREKRNKNKDH